MEKNTIFSIRRELKKKAHGTVRKHYVLLVFMMLVMALFGTEYRYSLSGWGEFSDVSEETGSEPEEQRENDPGNRLEDMEGYTIGDILSDIYSGKLSEGNEKVEELSQQVTDRFADSKALGMTNGILAQAVNSVMSGRLFSKLAQTISTITRSDEAAGVIFVLGSFLWYALIFFCLKNVYSAVLRRAFLTARTYRNLSASDVTWFMTVRKWFSACRAMFVVYIFQALWNLTIIGGFIKRYSYFAVPYIIAENPSVSPLEAVNLSRKMMNGHKFELLKYQITMLGWHILSALTFGITDLAYGNAYRLAAYTEFYAQLRDQALREEPDRAAILNDPYLFRQADRITLYEAYFDVVDEITVIHESRVTPTGWRKKAADWFGIWFYSFDKKKSYDAQEERTLAIEHDRKSMRGEAYPQRLSPLWGDRSEGKQAQFSFIRNYTVWTLILLFICFCFIGWSWEVILHYMQTGQFANRGTLYGPWLPIYGSGGLIVLILCSRFRKNPVAEFFAAIILCGVLEYVSAWQLETKYHQRWWSYDGYFLNLHGRICAEGLLVFGVGCCIVVYLVAPAFDHMLSKVKQKVLIVLCAVLGALFMVDMCYSQVHPNMAEGAIESTEETAAAESSAETETALPENS